MIVNSFSHFNLPDLSCSVVLWHVQTLTEAGNQQLLQEFVTYHRKVFSEVYGLSLDMYLTQDTIDLLG